MLNIFSIYELLNSIDLYKIAIRVKLKEEYENFVSNLKNNNKQLLLNLKCVIFYFSKKLLFFFLHNF